MKFEELKIGDRFRPCGFGEYLDVIYEKLDDDYIMDHNSKIVEHFNKFEIGDKTSFDKDKDVEKLGPAIDSELGEAIKTFLKENLRISIEKHRERYIGTGIKVSLKLCDEEINSSYIITKEYEY